MELTVKLLKQLGACEEGIGFCVQNKLIGFPMDRLKEVRGTHHFLHWLRVYTDIELDGDDNILSYKTPLRTIWHDNDEHGNVVCHKDSEGYQEWRDYDGNNNLIHIRRGGVSEALYEEWSEYDSNNNLIHFRDTYGYNITQEWEYDSNNNKIHFKDNISEEWWEYDSNNNLVSHRDTAGPTARYEYDSNNNNNMIHFKNSYKTEYWYTYNDDNTLRCVSSNRDTTRINYEYFVDGQLKRNNYLEIPFFVKDE